MWPLASSKHHVYNTPPAAHLDVMLQHRLQGPCGTSLLRLENGGDLC